jgi:hypothetical protein
MTFYTGGSERIRIDTSGNVGIGTSSPGYKLDVAASGARLGTGGTTNAQFIINGGSSGTAAGAVLSFQANGTGGLAIGNYSGIIGGTYDSTAYLYSGTGNALGFKAGGGTGYHAYIDTSGNVGIGTTSPSTYGKFVVAGGDGNTQFNVGTNGVLRIAGYSSTYSGALLESVNTAQSGYLPIAINGSYTVLATGNTERMRIDSSGNVLVGTSSTLPVNLASGKFQVLQTSASGHGASFKTNATSGFAAAAFSRDGNNGSVCEFGYDTSTTVGSISVTSVATTYNVTSDYRLKNVVGAVSDAGSRIDALEPVEYTWKSNGLRTRGFLAHKFQEVYAQSVTGTKDEIDADGNPVYQEMQASTAEVIADLIAEIQSLRKRLTALEST